MEDELFVKHYALYSKILRTVGLMPTDSTVLAYVKRLSYFLLLCSSVYFQSINYMRVEKTLFNIVWMLSFSSIMLLFGLRYFSFLICGPTAKQVFRRIGHDIEFTKNPVEADIFARHTKKSQLILKTYLAIGTFLTIYTFVVLVLPTLLRSQRQLLSLREYGYFYDERSLETDVISIIITAVTVIGIFSIVCTEACLSVYSSYLCGLIEIASYRMDLAIQHSEKIHSVLINVRPALDLQRKVFSTLTALQRDQTISYLIAIGAVIVSFAISLFRLLLVFKYYFSFDKLIFAGGAVLLEFVIMFLNNFCGQMVKDSGEAVYNTMVQSSWYNVPTRSQKILLFVMMRSIEMVECNLAGLYKLTFEGFAVMINSSFSYFTLLCSTQ